MDWIIQIFRVNQLEAHSDHTYYESYEALEKKEKCTDQSLNGQWEFTFSKNVKSRPENFYEEDFDAKTLIRLWCRAILNWLDMIRSATSIPCTMGERIPQRRTTV